MSSFGACRAKGRSYSRGGELEWMPEGGKVRGVRTGPWDQQGRGIEGLWIAARPGKAANARPRSVSLSPVTRSSEEPLKDLGWVD